MCVCVCVCVCVCAGISFQKEPELAILRKLPRRKDFLVDGRGSSSTGSDGVVDVGAGFLLRGLHDLIKFKSNQFPNQFIVTVHRFPSACSSFRTSSANYDYGGGIETIVYTREGAETERWNRTKTSDAADLIFLLAPPSGRFRI